MNSQLFTAQVTQSSPLRDSIKCCTLFTAQVTQNFQNCISFSLIWLFTAQVTQNIALYILPITPKLFTTQVTQNSQQLFVPHQLSLFTAQVIYISIFIKNMLNLRYPLATVHKSSQLVCFNARCKTRDLADFGSNQKANVSLLFGKQGAFSIG